MFKKNIMDIEKATELFRKRYSDWTKNPERETNGYNYERTFVEMMQKFEAEVFQYSLGELSANRNTQKKSRPV